MPPHTERTSQTPLAADPKKDSAQHVHLFELIERHKRFILGRTPGLNDHSSEGSAVDHLAVEETAAFEPFEESLGDPAAAVDERGAGNGSGTAIFDIARGADAPESSRTTTSTSCPKCSSWLAAQRIALRSKPSEYLNEKMLRSPNLITRSPDTPLPRRARRSKVGH